MDKITKRQIIQIHTLLSKHGITDKEDKAEFVILYTGDESKSSTKDLTYDQANLAIADLGGKVPIPTVPHSYYATFDKHNQQHLKLLSLCFEIDWVVYHDQLNKMVADLSKLGSWLKDYGYLHKSLKSYTHSELPRLITQFENMVKSYVK